MGHVAFWLAVGIVAILSVIAFKLAASALPWSGLKTAAALV